MSPLELSILFFFGLALLKVVALFIEEIKEDMEGEE